MAQGRVPRSNVNNIPYFTNADRIREKRDIQKRIFEQGESDRRKQHSTSFDEDNTSWLDGDISWLDYDTSKDVEIHGEATILPIDYIGAKSTVESMRNKKRGRYSVYSENEKYFILHAIVATQFLSPSHTWALLIDILSNKLRIPLRENTTRGWKKALDESTDAIEILRSRIRPYQAIHGGVPSEKESNAARVIGSNLRKNAAKTYLFYRALQFEANSAAALVNAIYGINETAKYLITIDPETGGHKESRKKEMIPTEVDDLSTPQEYIYTPPVVETQTDMSGITDEQITQLASEILQKSVDMMNENDRLKEHIAMLENRESELESKIEADFNETFADDHDAFKKTIEQQRKTIDKQAQIIEDLKKQITKPTVISKEGQGFFNNITNLMSGNKKED